MLMKKVFLMMFVGLMMSTAVYAQEEPKLSVKPTGRILFDAAYISPQHEEDKLKSGVGIPDFRVGVSGGIEGARYSSDEGISHKQFTLSSR